MRSGWATLAVVVMFAVGFARVISAIGYFADSRRVTDLGNGALHDQLWVYGIWDLAVAALALYAGYSLSRGGGFGRVLAYIWAVLAIVQSFMIINWAPWYAAAAITLAVLVVYGLSRPPVRESESLPPSGV
ncbi:MAG TPA: hypothetical protein VLK53_14210 [Gaiellaceae bacterium]|nr:hypothetical protein [Gaiellaceae bacterium]